LPPRASTRRWCSSIRRSRSRIAVASGDVRVRHRRYVGELLYAGRTKASCASSPPRRDAPGFYNLAFVASNKAYDAGLKSVKDLQGIRSQSRRSARASITRSAKIAERFGFPISAVTVKPLQSNTNAIAALIGGRVDAAVLPGSPVLPALQKGDIKLLAWAADVAPNVTSSAASTATKVGE